jgi:hypothetical protein
LGVELAVLLNRFVGTERFLRRRRPTATVTFPGRRRRPDLVKLFGAVRFAPDGRRGVNHPGAAESRRDHRQVEGNGFYPSRYAPGSA